MSMHGFGNLGLTRVLRDEGMTDIDRKSRWVDQALCWRNPSDPKLSVSVCGWVGR